MSELSSKVSNLSMTLEGTAVASDYKSSNSHNLDQTVTDVAKRIYVIGLKNALEVLRYFDQDYVSFAYLEEKTGLAKSSLSSTLGQLISADLIRYGQFAPSISDRTRRPHYRFVQLTDDGKYVRLHLDDLSEKIEGVLSVLGYSKLSRNVRTSEYYVRLGIVKALHDSPGGLTREGLSKKLHKPSSFLSTLSKQMNALRPLIIERGNPRAPRTKLYFLDPEKNLKAMSERRRDDFMKNFNYLLVLTAELKMEDIVKELSRVRS